MVWFSSFCVCGTWYVSFFSYKLNYVLKKIFFFFGHILSRILSICNWRHSGAVVYQKSERAFVVSIWDSSGTDKCWAQRPRIMFQFAPIGVKGWARHFSFPTLSFFQPWTRVFKLLRVLKLSGKDFLKLLSTTLILKSFFSRCRLASVKSGCLLDTEITRTFFTFPRAERERLWAVVLKTP